MKCSLAKSASRKWKSCWLNKTSEFALDLAFYWRNYWPLCSAVLGDYLLSRVTRVITGAFVRMAFLLAMLASGVGLSAQAQGPNPELDALRAEAAAAAKPQKISTKAFAGRSQFSGAKLSPDGQKLASGTSKDGKEFVIVADAATGSVTATYGIGEDNRLVWLRWAGNGKLLLSASTLDDANRYFTRLFVIDLASSAISYIGRKELIRDGDDVVFVAEDGSYALVSLQRNRRHYPSVYRFELEPDGSRDAVQDSKVGVWDWLTDHEGTVRIGAGGRRGTFKLYYRSMPSDKLDLVQKIEIESLRKPNGNYRYLSFLGVQPGTDLGYVLHENDAGRVGLRRFDFLLGKLGETVYEHPDHDLNDVGFSATGEPIWVSYTDDRTNIVWFDKQLAAIQRGLNSALEEEQVSIQSRSKNNERLLVRAGGEGDPGALYVYTRASRSIEALGELRPSVDFLQLSKPKAIEYTARDGTNIRGYLTLPRGRGDAGLPLIILPHGGPFGVRDRLRYDDEVQLLANRGYAVLQPNFRGSGGYGDAFFDKGIGEVGRAMQDDLDDAMDWAVGEGIADPNRVCIVGASYGGYAALWGVVRNPERYRCAASWAGVYDWDSMMRWDSNWMSRRGARRWQDRLEGKEGGDLTAVSPIEFVDQINRPVLLAHGTYDGRVNVGQYHRMLGKLKDNGATVAELLIEEEGHSFSSAENEQKWYDALDAFLAEHNPAD
jgi:dipeptidyl aminopeptidase/acylaminoacyl peptidase